jgi:MFS transporter, SHS family, lactate transporter
MIGNTLLACWWMASNFVLYYSIWALFATHLQADLKLTTMGTAVPFMIANILSFVGMAFWGWTADFIGRRWAMMIPAAIAIFIAPIYLFTSDPLWITIGFGLQGAFGGALYSQLPSYLSERFPTEVRATGSAFCYHQGAILGGLVAPVLAYFATTYNIGYAIPMFIGTVVAAASVLVALSLSPETKGKELVSDLAVA